MDPGRKRSVSNRAEAPEDKELLQMALRFAAVLAFFLLLIPVESRSALDRASIECLGCHDASIASDVTFKICSEPDCDHPIGVDYMTLASSNHGLISPFSLPPSIKLVDGSIGCGTCHTPYRNNSVHNVYSSLRSLYPQIADPMLVMDNRKSELCFACHAK